jgi:hypothetical protein
MHNYEKRDLFLSSAKIVICSDCNKNSYKTDLPQITISYQATDLIDIIFTQEYQIPQ